MQTRSHELYVCAESRGARGPGRAVQQVPVHPPREGLRSPGLRCPRQSRSRTLRKNNKWSVWVFTI